MRYGGGGTSFFFFEVYSYAGASGRGRAVEGHLRRLYSVERLVMGRSLGTWVQSEAGIGSSWVPGRSGGVNGMSKLGVKKRRHLGQRPQASTAVASSGDSIRVHKFQVVVNQIHRDLYSKSICTPMILFFIVFPFQLFTQGWPANSAGTLFSRDPEYSSSEWRAFPQLALVLVIVVTHSLPDASR